MPRLSRLIAGVSLLLLLGMTPALAVGSGREQSSPACADLIVNGGFEYVGNWVLGASPSPPRYTTANKHSGAYSLSLGISDGVNRQSFSSARQAVTIPAGVQSARLTFWFYAIATGAPTTDYMELAILSPDGVVLDKPWFSRNDSQSWNSLTFDLSAWRGRTIQLYFNVYNDGLGGMAQMYLDDVSFAVCSDGGGGGLVTPALTPGTPGGATVTPTRGPCPKPSLNCGIPTPKASATTAPSSATQSAPAYQEPAIIQPAPTYQQPAIIQPAPTYQEPAIIAPTVEAPPAIITVAVEGAAPAEGALPTMEMPAIIGAEGATPASPQALVLATPGLWLDPVVNGGFEQDFTGWTPVGEAPAPLIATDVVHGGQRAAQLGALEGVPAGHTTVYQELTVPAEFGAVAVDFWVYPWSGDNAGSDYQEAALVAPDGSIVAELWHTQSNERAWTRRFIPVSGFTGAPLQLRFTVYNDGTGDATGMVIDDVSMVPLSPDGARGGDSTAGVALPQPNVTRLSLVVTVTPSAGVLGGSVAAPAAELLVSPAAPALAPVVAATRSASQRGAVFERWPPNWPLALVALGVFIALFVVLINPRWRKYWWLVLIVGALVALLVLWLMRRA